MKSLVFIILLSAIPFSLENFNLTNQNERILSRKRRYLVFPEGSSLQLVYCLTMPSLGMGKIFTIGSTAAMAWMLPHEPMVFLDKKHRKGTEAEVTKAPAHEDSSDYIFHTPEVIPQLPEYQDLETQEIIRPNSYHNFENYQRIGRPHVDYFPKPLRTSFGQHAVEPGHWHIYRRTRRSLYGKLERLLSALSKDGRACVMKMICEVSQIAERKGSFMEEIIKVIFRIKVNNMKNEDMYDAAANKNHNCNERYKSCPGSLFNMK